MNYNELTLTQLQQIESEIDTKIEALAQEYRLVKKFIAAKISPFAVGDVLTWTKKVGCGSKELTYRGRVVGICDSGRSWNVVLITKDGKDSRRHRRIWQQFDKPTRSTTI